LNAEWDREYPFLQGKPIPGGRAGDVGRNGFAILMKLCQEWFFNGKYANKCIFNQHNNVEHLHLNAQILTHMFAGGDAAAVYNRPFTLVHLSLPFVMRDGFKFSVYLESIDGN